MLEFVADVAAREGLSDYRVVVNAGAGAGQTIFHLHWHVLGGGQHREDGVSRIETIEDEIKEAMLARDAERRDALRLIVNALKNSEKELQRPLSEDEELQVLQRERKRRVEAAEAFRTGGREEQAEAEERELAILEEFMPEPLGEDEIEEIVDDAIAEVGATSMADLGRVMADVMPQIAGPRRRLRRQPDRPRKARMSGGAATGALAPQPGRPATRCSSAPPGRRTATPSCSARSSRAGATSGSRTSSRTPPAGATSGTSSSGSAGAASSKA